MQINISKRANSAGLFFIILSCFFIPFSTSLMGTTALLGCLCWLFTGKPLSLPRLMVINPPVLLSILLLILLSAGLFYSPAPLKDAFAVLKKYRELLFFAIVLSLFTSSKRAATIAENSFFAGCCLLLVVSYGIYFSLIPMEKLGYSVVHHITHSFFMAILAFWCLHRSFHQKRYLYLALFSLTTINLFFIAPGRTGMLIYIILITLTAYQRLSLKKSILATILIAILIAATFMLSHNFSSRVSTAIQEIKTYHSSSSRTSLGMRFDWWRNSVDLIAEKPFFGHGIGSFLPAQKKLIQRQKKHTKISDNPHNEYLFIGVQAGFIGMVLFIALLTTQVIYSFRLKTPQKYLLQGVTMAMACGCLMNSFLFDSHQGHFFAIISAILMVPTIAKGTG